MNLPNKLTVTRMFLIPLYMIFAFNLPGNFFKNTGIAEYAPYIALLLYIIASITDAADGHIARKNHLVTNFGKFLDPIADKLLVTAAMLSLIQYNDWYLWATMAILTREFIVTGMRLLAAGEGNVIAAGKLGKIKMVLQTIAIIVLLCAHIVVDNWGADFKAFGNVLLVAGDVLMWAAVIATIISGIEYIVKNLGYLKKNI